MGHIVVIGGSAGGLEALKRILTGLETDLPAALFVVLHTAAEGPSMLPTLLRRYGSLPAEYAVDGEAIVEGRIYVAPQNHHLLVESQHVVVSRGPKENGFRPAVDPLFRTAAEAYGQKVIGVILSGGRNDGTAGLAAIKNHGGTAIVQQPEDASATGMPESAIRHVNVDHVASADEIPKLISDLVRDRDMKSTSTPKIRRARPDVAEVGRAALHSKQQHLGEPTPFICPECGGPLWEGKEGKLLRFRCHVGHVYTGEVLVEEQGDAIEQAMWTALRTLEEGAALRQRMAAHARQHGMAEIAHQYETQGAELEGQAGVVRRALVLDERTGEDEAAPSITARARRAVDK